ncbi:hypothetical protein DL771_008391 [Monosporascus sp. 5C6A]|nr:hypothetical protein DL771_008391 [Monosporascus sp. 5C6A]
MDRIATDKGARVLYLAAEPGSEWDYIHPKATKAEIQNLITSKIGTVPPSAVLLLNMGADRPLSANLLECLPAETQVKAGTLLTSSMARIPPGHLKQEIRSILVDVKYSLWPAQQATDTSQRRQELEVVTLEDLTTKDHVGSDACVVSWPPEPSTVPVQVEPIDTRIKFRNDRTYWLVGLTGGLGLSLCEWMAKQGARNICNRESVRSVYNQICQKMPPIAGVAQGAMVLHDTVFSDLDIERIKKVTQPKVNGSSYLEEIFHDINFDFFVFFSSMACVTGNPGQSAYAAANMFMSGLAAQRRHKGLNTSIMHISAIFGNGYVTKKLTLAQQEFSRKVGNMWLSKQDFRQIFAKAVFTGQHKRGSFPELSTGLITINNGDNSKKNITWFYNPMFQHCIKESQDSELLLPKELTPNLDPNDKTEAKKPKPQVTSSAKVKAAEQNQTEISTADGKASDRRADTTKAGAVTSPSVQWKSLPKPITPSPITPSGDSDNKSLSISNGVSIDSASLDTAYTGKSTPSSNTGSEIDTYGGRSQGSVWSIDTVESEMADPASALNITLTIDLDGSLDVNRFERAVKLIGQRHEALQTRFVTRDDSSQAMQEILLHPTLALEKQDIANDVKAEQIYRKLQQYRYKLAKGKNIRILLLRKSSKSFRLIIGYHHINMDGISLEIMLRELQTAYNSKKLPNLNSIFQYPTFAEQQHRKFESGKWQDKITFWKNEFSGRTPSVLPLLPLTKTRSRTALTAYSSHTAKFRLDQEALARIQSTCDGSKATPFQFHLAVFYTLLFRLVDVEDICISISSANRQNTAIMQSIGITLKLIRSKAIAAFAHSKVPFDIIVNELGIPRATTHSPLFQGQAAYDLSLDIIENPGGKCRIIIAGSLHKHRWPKTLVHRINKMVKRYGSRSAVMDGYGNSLTYLHLARKVSTLAASMHRIGSGSRVGVYVNAGADWVCSLLAILRRNVVYVPLNATSGSERLFAILQDSKPNLLLINNSTEKDARSQFVPLLAADQILNVDHVSTTAANTLNNAAKPDSVAALMYTSSSTRVPKGIVMKHASFRNNIEIMTEKLGYHPVAISSIIANRGITFTTSTFSELISWIRYGNIDELRKSNWKTVQSGLRLVDCYGPTKITFCCHSREMDYQTRNTSSNTGLKVWPNYSTYIVDASMKAVPVGIPGKVLIGGAGVVAGYLHTKLNTRSFAQDNFASPEFQTQSWTWLHRTGDFGRISKANKRLFLKGRIMDDTQVKLRGLRIDLRKVESAIIYAAKGSIVDCAVNVRQSETTTTEYLIAFAATASAANIENLDQIVHQLPLPQYMRPAALVRLEKMPTNISGKIDRSALKSIPFPQTPENNALGSQYSGSEILNNTESRLKQLWESIFFKEIVSQHQISITSDFFHVGGSSILLINLRADIQDTFNVVVSLFQLFRR